MDKSFPYGTKQRDTGDHGWMVDRKFWGAPPTAQKKQEEGQMEEPQRGPQGPKPLGSVCVGALENRGFERRKNGASSDSWKTIMGGQTCGEK